MSEPSIEEIVETDAACLAHWKRCYGQLWEVKVAFDKEHTGVIAQEQKSHNCPAVTTDPGLTESLNSFNSAAVLAILDELEKARRERNSARTLLLYAGALLSLEIPESPLLARIQAELEK